MATKAATAPAAAAADPPKKKGGFMKLALLLLVAILVGGGGLGATLYFTGVLGTGNREDANRPHLVPRSDISGAALEHAEREAAAGRIDPRAFQATYYTMENQFTSNLRGGSSFVQVGIGLSTYFDERVIERVRTHEMAIRSAILLTLSEADPATVSTAEGKQQLRLTLRNAVNEVLTNKEGFGGIDEVFFTSFVTQ